MPDERPVAPVVIVSPEAGPQPPYWFPTPRSFLTVAIVLLIMSIVWMLMLRPPQLDERISNLLSGILGILIGCFKDVYSFNFNSTQASEDKNKTISDQSRALAVSTPAPSTITTTTIDPGPPPTATTTTSPAETPAAKV